MSDLRCTQCGTEKSYADANIADIRRTCGGNDEMNDRGSYCGDKHNWVEQ